MFTSAAALWPMSTTFLPPHKYFKELSFWGFPVVLLLKCFFLCCRFSFKANHPLGMRTWPEEGTEQVRANFRGETDCAQIRMAATGAEQAAASASVGNGLAEGFREERSTFCKGFLLQRLELQR